MTDQHSSRGLFNTASGGRAFRRKKKGGALDRFAEELSKHDLEAGDPGGNAGECAVRVGARRTQGNLMLQRIRKGLGWQAR